MKRILIVDDETAIIEIISEILDGNDYAIETAQNGLDAWRLYQDQPFDLVITDIVMPEMNGMELISAIRAQEPELKAIVMTGYAKQHNLDELRSASDRGHIQVFEKPLNLMQVLNTINVMLA